MTKQFRCFLHFLIVSNILEKFKSQIEFKKLPLDAVHLLIGKWFVRLSFGDLSPV